MGDKSPGIRTPLYKETNIVPNDCCRICRIYVKINCLSIIKSTFLGIITRIFHKHCHLFCRLCTWLNGIICQKCHWEVVKWRVYQSRLLLFTSAGRAVRVDSRVFTQNSNINMYSGNRARILVWRLHFLFLWKNGARKSHAARQTLKVRNVLSEVFVDPVLKITLVRSLTRNIGRRRKMQAAPKMITYLYKVVCFFFATRKLSFRIRRFIFCCPKQVNLETLVVDVWTAQTGCWDATDSQFADMRVHKRLERTDNQNYCMARVWVVKVLANIR